MTDAVYTPSTDTHPLWLKALSALGVVWYGFGLFQFWLGYSMDPAAAAAAGQITAAHGTAIAATPALVWLFYALASGAGLVGAVLLFMAKPAAKLVFGVSLMSAAAFYLWVYGISGTGADRPSEEMIIGLVVIAVTSLFFALSRRFG